MSTISELQQRQLQRKLERKRKRKRTLTIAVLFLIIIIFSLLYVKINSKKSSKTEDFSTQSLAVYPPTPKKSTDILSALPQKDGVKTAYLTFDDGPTTSVTPAILDILRKYEIKATFFMVGSLIEKNPGMAYRVYSEGHTLANHSYRHNYSYLYENADNFMSELDATHSLITDITGKSNYPKIFRFPGGSYNSGSHGEAKQTYKQLLEKNGYRYCDWNCLSGDAEYKSPDVATLLGRVKSSSNGKEDIVILMHDSATKKINIQALPQIIEYLLSEGYTFSTLDKIP